VCAPGGRAARGGAPRPPRPTSNMPRRPLRSLPGSANSKRPDQSSSAWTMVLCLSHFSHAQSQRSETPLGRDGGLRDHIFLTGRCVILFGVCEGSFSLRSPSSARPDRHPRDTRLGAPAVLPLPNRANGRTGFQKRPRDTRQPCAPHPAQRTGHSPRSLTVTSHIPPGHMTHAGPSNAAPTVQVIHLLLCPPNQVARTADDPAALRARKNATRVKTTASKTPQALVTTAYSDTYMRIQQ